MRSYRKSFTKVGAFPNPVVAVVPKPVAAGVPNVVPVPNPVVCVWGVPKRLGAEVAGVPNPKDGVPNPPVKEDKIQFIPN